MCPLVLYIPGIPTKTPGIHITMIVSQTRATITSPILFIETTKCTPYGRQTITSAELVVVYSESNRTYLLYIEESIDIQSDKTINEDRPMSPSNVFIREHTYPP